MHVRRFLGRPILLLLAIASASVLLPRLSFAQEGKGPTKSDAVSASSVGAVNSRGQDASKDVWSERMEQRVWSALAQSDRLFTTIDLVRCDRPKCELHFTGVIGDPKVADFSSQLIRLVGFDDRGVPIIKEMTSSQREIQPGNRVTVLIFSTESSVPH